MPPPRGELFIWWTSDAECQKLGPEAHASLPPYVRAQYALRYAQAGLGRLWFDPRFGMLEIREWPRTMFTDMLKTSGGVVFPGKDLPLFTDSVGGIVTDFKVRVM